MAIEMYKVRAAILAALCLENNNPHVDKLPGDLNSAPFNTVYPFCINVEGQTLKGRTLHVKLLSQAEARKFSKTKAKRPHRILAWCDSCNAWQFAGKIVQHQKYCGKGIQVRVLRKLVLDAFGIVRPLGSFHDGFPRDFSTGESAVILAPTSPGADPLAIRVLSPGDAKKRSQRIRPVGVRMLIWCYSCRVWRSWTSMLNHGCAGIFELRNVSETTLDTILVNNVSNIDVRTISWVTRTVEDMATSASQYDDRKKREEKTNG